MPPRQTDPAHPLLPPPARRGPSASDICALLVLVLPLVLALLRL